MIGQVPTVAPTISGDFATLMEWADKVRTLKVRTNADTPEDSAQGPRSYGAEGIGLCRTEHMFFGEQRIVAMRKMILADDEAGRKAALAELEPFQKRGLRRHLRGDGRPAGDDPAARPAAPRVPAQGRQPDGPGRSRPRSSASAVEKVRRRVEELHEPNPMLGLRGCRLPIKFPEIGDMQVRAIIDAAIEVKKRGKTVLPEIMIPLVGTVEELFFLKKRAIAVAEEQMKKAGVKVEYLIGTMIELPRAALTADQIAEEAEFFSFGTNDLTQMTFGFSPRRHRLVHAGLCRAEDPAGQPVPDARRQGGRPARRDRRDQGPQGPAGEARRAPEGRDLRRARRRPRQRRLLPQGGDGLRLLLAVPRADRPPGRRAGRAGGRWNHQPG